MMNYETEVMVAVPSWKVEFMEKKRRKSKTDEVPQWKRELLRRIQSKTQRMIEEPQPDILEEHIPKVSKNIFLIHEKKQHNRLASAPPPKTTTSDVSLTSKVTLSVDNVIIIEKENTTVVDDVTSTSSSDSVFSEAKEYPKAGIVHRLMGRFQSGKTGAPKKKQFHIPTYQKSKSSDRVLKTRPTTPPPTPQPAHAEETPTPELTVPESHPRTSSMPSDMLTPLLISSAKPFSRQTISNAADHGYHHVSVPIRKVSSPTSPSYTSTIKTEPAPPKLEHAPPKIEHALLKVEPAPPKKTDPEPVASFAADLSSLHSNWEIPSVKIKELDNTETQKSAEVSVPEHLNLENGETLHSSGNKDQQVISNEKLATTTTTKLQDKSNFAQFQSVVKTQANGDLKQRKDTVPAKNFEKPKRETFVIPKQPSVDIIKPTEIKNEVKPRPLVMKENRGNKPFAKKRDKKEDQMWREVNESFDESTMKSKAAVLANNIMKTSKTFKITPSKQAQKNNTATPTQTQVPKRHPIPNGPAFKEAKSASLERPDIDKEMTLPSNSKVVVMATPAREWPEVKPPNDLPSTSIDDIIDDSVVITPVSSLPVSPKVEKKVEKEVEKKVEKKLEEVGIAKPAPEVIPTPAPKEIKTQNSYIGRTSGNAISIVPKSEPAPRHSFFGSKKPAAGRGKSFVIDPSKFKRSSAQPPADTSASGTMQDSGKSRMIVPAAKSSGVTETDFAGEQAKSGKRKLTVDQIKVIGGYVSLEKSCLAKDSKRKKSFTLAFCEDNLETMHSYQSERSMLREDSSSNVEIKNVTKSPGFGKDSTIGKYTPKYLLSMKDSEILDGDDDTESKSASSENPSGSGGSTPNDATPLSDDTAAAWSDTTSSSTDILF